MALRSFSSMRCAFLMALGRGSSMLLAREEDRRPGSEWPEKMCERRNFLSVLSLMFESTVDLAEGGWMGVV